MSRLFALLRLLSLRDVTDAAGIFITARCQTSPIMSAWIIISKSVLVIVPLSVVAPSAVSHPLQVCTITDTGNCVGVINDLKSKWLGKEYATGAACEEVLNRLVGTKSNQEDGEIRAAHNREVLVRFQERHVRLEL